MAKSRSAPSRSRRGQRQCVGNAVDPLGCSSTQQAPSRIGAEGRQEGRKACPRPSPGVGDVLANGGSSNRHAGPSGRCEWRDLGDLLPVSLTGWGPARRSVELPQTSSQQIIRWPSTRAGGMQVHTSRFANTSPTTISPYIGGCCIRHIYTCSHTAHHYIEDHRHSLIPIFPPEELTKKKKTKSLPIILRQGPSLRAPPSFNQKSSRVAEKPRTV